METTELTPLDAAKKLIADEEIKIIEQATIELKEFLEILKEKYNCSLQAIGTFEGNSFQSAIRIIINK